MTKEDREGGKENRYSWARLCCAPKAKLSWTPEELCEPSFSQLHALLWSSFEDKSPAKALTCQSASWGKTLITQEDPSSLGCASAIGDCLELLEDLESG